VAEEGGRRDLMGPAKLLVSKKKREKEMYVGLPK